MSGALEISAFDKKLLELASSGLSGNELSRSLGGVYSPAECVLRVRTLLADKDIWTDPERKKMLLMRIYDLVDDLARVAATTEDTKDFTALTKALDLLRKTLNDQQGSTEEELRNLVRLQAEAMTQYLSRAMKYALEVLAREYPELPAEVLEDAFEEALVRESD